LRHKDNRFLCTHSDYYTNISQSSINPRFFTLNDEEGIKMMNGCYFYVNFINFTGLI